MNIKSGSGPLFTNPDPEVARTIFCKKSRALTDKVMSVKEAVKKFIKDGDYIASGGFWTNRIATAVLHKILRQNKKNLCFAGHTVNGRLKPTT